VNSRAAPPALHSLWLAAALAVALSLSAAAEQAAPQGSLPAGDLAAIRQALTRLEAQVNQLAARLDDLVRRLEKLEAAAPRLPGPPEAKVTILGASGPRREGDELRVRVTVSGPCYLSLFNLDPHGGITVLHPLDFRADNFLPQAGTYDFPASGTTWRVGPPFGANTIKAVAALIKWPVTKEVAAHQALPLIGSGEATITYEVAPRP